MKYHEAYDFCSRGATQLLGRVALCDVLDVHVAREHRNTINLVRGGMVTSDLFV